MSDQELHDGACHCGAVRFRLRLADGLNTLRRCNCSFCRMRGAVVVSARIEEFELLAGEDDLTLYQYHTRTAKHYFCRHCGIYTHHLPRSGAGLFGVNVACIEGLSPFDFDDIPVLDGINHPGDVGGAPKIAGRLRYAPAEEIGN